MAWYTPSHLIYHEAKSSIIWVSPALFILIRFIMYLFYFYRWIENKPLLTGHRFFHLQWRRRATKQQHAVTQWPVKTSVFSGAKDKAQQWAAAVRSATSHQGHYSAMAGALATIAANLSPGEWLKTTSAEENGTSFDKWIKKYERWESIACGVRL